MQIQKKPIYLILFVLLIGCNSSPQPINYGTDTCSYCIMTIVDKIHAAEILTHKGKVYKFDATECMINFSNDFEKSKIKLYLSNDYMTPEKLIDARKATFLISKEIPSPMGAFLSAFEDKIQAKKLQTQKGGELYTWEKLCTHLK